MALPIKSLDISIRGPGFIIFSPDSVKHITAGENYLDRHFTKPDDVESHARAGGIIGVNLGSPGYYLIHFYEGYPPDGFDDRISASIRLVQKVEGGSICIRGLFSLIDWEPEGLEIDSLEREDGYYHLTLCTGLSASGAIGDAQNIYFFLKKLDGPIEWVYRGVPQLLAIE